MREREVSLGVPNHLKKRRPVGEDLLHTMYYTARSSSSVSAAPAVAPPATVIAPHLHPHHHGTHTHAPATGDTLAWLDTSLCNPYNTEARRDLAGFLPMPTTAPPVVRPLPAATAPSPAPPSSTTTTAARTTYQAVCEREYSLRVRLVVERMHKGRQSHRKPQFDLNLADLPWDESQVLGFLRANTATRMSMLEEYISQDIVVRPDVYVPYKDEVDALGIADLDVIPATDTRPRYARNVRVLQADVERACHAEREPSAHQDGHDGPPMQRVEDRIRNVIRNIPGFGEDESGGRGYRGTKRPKTDPDADQTTDHELERFIANFRLSGEDHPDASSSSTTTGIPRRPPPPFPRMARRTFESPAFLETFFRKHGMHVQDRPRPTSHLHTDACWRDRRTTTTAAVTTDSDVSPPAPPRPITVDDPEALYKSVYGMCGYEMLARVQYGIGRNNTIPSTERLDQIIQEQLFPFFAAHRDKRCPCEGLTINDIETWCVRDLRRTGWANSHRVTGKCMNRPYFMRVGRSPGKKFVPSLPASPNEREAGEKDASSTSTTWRGRTVTTDLMALHEWHTLEELRREQASSPPATSPEAAPSHRRSRNRPLSTSRTQHAVLASQDPRLVRFAHFFPSHVTAPIRDILALRSPVTTVTADDESGETKNSNGKRPLPVDPEKSMANLYPPVHYAFVDQHFYLVEDPQTHRSAAATYDHMAFGSYDTTLSGKNAPPPATTTVTAPTVASAPTPGDAPIFLDDGDDLTDSEETMNPTANPTKNLSAGGSAGTEEKQDGPEEGTGTVTAANPPGEEEVAEMAPMDTEDHEVKGSTNFLLTAGVRSMQLLPSGRFGIQGRDKAYKRHLLKFQKRDAVRTKRAIQRAANTATPSTNPPSAAVDPPPLPSPSDASLVVDPSGEDAEEAKTAQDEEAEQLRASTAAEVVVLWEEEAELRRKQAERAEAAADQVSQSGTGTKKKKSAKGATPDPLAHTKGYPPISEVIEVEWDGEEGSWYTLVTPPPPTAADATVTSAASPTPTSHSHKSKKVQLERSVYHQHQQRLASQRALIDAHKAATTHPTYTLPPADADDLDTPEKRAAWCAAHPGLDPDDPEVRCPRRNAWIFHHFDAGLKAQAVYDEETGHFLPKTVVVVRNQPDLEFLLILYIRLYQTPLEEQERHRINGALRSLFVGRTVVYALPNWRRIKDLYRVMYPASRPYAGQSLTILSMELLSEMSQSDDLRDTDLVQTMDLRRFPPGTYRLSDCRSQFPEDLCRVANRHSPAQPIHIFTRTTDCPYETTHDLSDSLGTTTPTASSSSASPSSDPARSTGIHVCRVPALAPDPESPAGARAMHIPPIPERHLLHRGGRRWVSTGKFILTTERLCTDAQWRYSRITTDRNPDRPIRRYHTRPYHETTHFGPSSRVPGTGYGTGEGVQFQTQVTRNHIHPVTERRSSDYVTVLHQDGELDPWPDPPAHWSEPPPCSVTELLPPITANVPDLVGTDRTRSYGVSNGAERYAAASALLQQALEQLTKAGHLPPHPPGDGAPALYAVWNGSRYDVPFDDEDRTGNGTPPPAIRIRIEECFVCEHIPYEERFRQDLTASYTGATLRHLLGTTTIPAECHTYDDVIRKRQPHRRPGKTTDPAPETPTVTTAPSIALDYIPVLDPTDLAAPFDPRPYQSALDARKPPPRFPTGYYLVRTPNHLDPVYQHNHPARALKLRHLRFPPQGGEVLLLHSTAFELWVAGCIDLEDIRVVWESRPPPPSAYTAAVAPAKPREVALASLLVNYILLLYRHPAFQDPALAYLPKLMFNYVVGAMQGSNHLTSHLVSHAELGSIDTPMTLFFWGERCVNARVWTRQCTVQFGYEEEPILYESAVARVDQPSPLHMAPVYHAITQIQAMAVFDTLMQLHPSWQTDLYRLVRHGTPLPIPCIGTHTSAQIVRPLAEDYCLIQIKADAMEIHCRSDNPHVQALCDAAARNTERMQHITNADRLTHGLLQCWKKEAVPSHAEYFRYEHADMFLGRDLRQWLGKLRFGDTPLWATLWGGDGTPLPRADPALRFSPHPNARGCRILPPAARTPHAPRIDALVSDTGLGPVVYPLTDDERNEVETEAEAKRQRRLPYPEEGGPAFGPVDDARTHCDIQIAHIARTPRQHLRWFAYVYDRYLSAGFMWPPPYCDPQVCIALRARPPPSVEELLQRYPETVPLTDPPARHPAVYAPGALDDPHRTQFVDTRAVTPCLLLDRANPHAEALFRDEAKYEEFFRDLLRVPRYVHGSDRGAYRYTVNTLMAADRWIPGQHHPVGNNGLSLEGPAGCGKTFALHVIVRHLVEEQNLCVYLMAPTHSAVGQIRLSLRAKKVPDPAYRGFVFTGTLHSAFGANPSQTEIRRFVEDVNALFRGIVFRKPPDVIIVDEQSMLTGFGWYLLLLIHTLRPRIRFIIAGDPNQLPPVRDRVLEQCQSNFRALLPANVAAQANGLNYSDMTSWLTDLLFDPTYGLPGVRIVLRGSHRSVTLDPLMERLLSRKHPLQAIAELLVEWKQNRNSVPRLPVGPECPVPLRALAEDNRTVRHANWMINEVRRAPVTPNTPNTVDAPVPSVYEPLDPPGEGPILPRIPHCRVEQRELVQQYLCRTKRAAGVVTYGMFQQEIRRWRVRYHCTDYTQDFHYRVGTLVICRANRVAFAKPHKPDPLVGTAAIANPSDGAEEVAADTRTLVGFVNARQARIVGFYPPNTWYCTGKQRSVFLERYRPAAADTNEHFLHPENVCRVATVGLQWTEWDRSHDSGAFGENTPPEFDTNHLRWQAIILLDEFYALFTPAHALTFYGCQGSTIRELVVILDVARPEAPFQKGNRIKERGLFVGFSRPDRPEHRGLWGELSPYSHPWMYAHNARDIVRNALFGMLLLFDVAYRPPTQGNLQARNREVWGKYETPGMPWCGLDDMARGLVAWLEDERERIAEEANQSATAPAVPDTHWMRCCHACKVNTPDRLPCDIATLLDPSGTRPAQRLYLQQLPVDPAVLGRCVDTAHCIPIQDVPDEWVHPQRPIVRLCYGCHYRQWDTHRFGNRSAVAGTATTPAGGPPLPARNPEAITAAPAAAPLPVAPEHHHHHKRGGGAVTAGNPPPPTKRPHIAASTTTPTPTPAPPAAARVISFQGLGSRWMAQPPPSPPTGCPASSSPPAASP